MVVFMTIILSEFSNAFSKDAIVFATFGTRSRSNDTYSYFEKIAKNQFKNYTIKWAYTSKKIRAIEDNIQKQSLSDVLKKLHFDGYNRIFVQPLFIFPAYEYLLLLEEVNKFNNMKIIVSKPLIYDELDMEAALDIVSKYFSPDSLNIIVAHGTKEKLGNFNHIYHSLASYINNNYSNAVLITIDGQPGISKLTEKLTTRTYSKALFIPFMFTAGIHIEEDVNSDNSLIKTTVKKYVKEISILDVTYNNSSYYMGLGLNRGIVELFIKKLKQIIKNGN